MQNTSTATPPGFLARHEKSAVLVASLLAVVVYVAVWQDFFSSKLLFGDYGLAIPSLLDQYFWVHRHGLAVQWFTPGACGGIPNFPEPQSVQYSLLTLLTYFFGPTASVKIAFPLHAWIGFVGAYVLCRSAYRLDWGMAALAALLFMFNGFFAYRMVASHLFYGLMLTPLVAWALLRAFEQDTWFPAMSGSCVVAGLMTFYVYGGGLGVLVPFCLGIAVLLGIDFSQREKLPPFLHVGRALLAVTVVTGALCAPKIIAAGAFMANFPRDSYLLPGFASLHDMFQALWLMFFMSPDQPAIHILPHITHYQWMLDRHEWEFGVSMAPLVLLLAGLHHPEAFRLRWRSRKVFFGLATAVVLAVPLAINLYTPEWNAILKQVPVIKSSSNLFRYLWIWVVFLCFWPVIFFDRFNRMTPSGQRVTMLFAALLVVLTFAIQDKDYYRLGSTYDPTSVEQAYDRVASGQVEPQIRSVNLLRDAQGKVVTGGDRNKSLADGISQYACYQPIFGYRLEKFPYGSMRPGDPFEEAEPGRLNFKNPVCMVYPEANQCSPGDAFSTDQQDALRSFLQYDSYPFALSARQVNANFVAGAMAVLLVVLLAFRLFELFRKYRGLKP